MARVILITGVSSGIGRAAVLAFIRHGDHVVGLARRTERLTELAQTVDQLPQPHGEFLPVTGDVTVIADVERAVQAAVTRFERVDVLIANAGIGQRGAVADANWEDLETLLRLNIDGVLHSMRAVVPVMRSQGSGHIITISSVAASLVSPYAATYAASKAFVSSLVKSMRLELSADHIRISDVLVGRTDTEFNTARLGAGARQASRLPSMSAEQVAAALVGIVQRPRDTVVLRLFDRLIVLGNRWLPGLMGALAARQYR